MLVEKLILQQLHKLYKLTLPLEIELREAAHLGNTSLKKQASLSLVFEKLTRLNQEIEHNNLYNVTSILERHYSELVQLLSRHDVTEIITHIIELKEMLGEVKSNNVSSSSKIYIPEFKNRELLAGNK